MRAGRGITRRAVSTAALAGFAVAACQGKDAPQVPSLLEGRLADWTQDILSDDPELATQSGVAESVLGARFNDRLTGRGSAAAERRRTAALRRVLELKALREGKPADPNGTLGFIQAQFDAAAELARFEYGRFAPLSGAQPYVLDQAGSAFLTLPDFLESRQPMATVDQAGDYLARLRAAAISIAEDMDHARDDAAKGTVAPRVILQRVYQRTLASVGAGAEGNPFFLGFARRIDALVPPAADPAQANDAQRRAGAVKGQALAIVREGIVPAQLRLGQAVNVLAGQSGEEPGVWRLPNGEAYYAACLAYETSTSLTADEIHAVGTERVQEVSGQLDGVLRRMGRTEGTVGQRMAALTADPAYRYANDDVGRAQLLADVRARIERAKTQSANWFAHQPKASLEVRRVPLLAEADSSGAYYEPPSVDGSQAGIYYINLRDMADMSKIDLPTQDYHEAIPGHHLQTALARELEGLPLLRRLMTFTAFSEGWATYAEQLADEQGLFAQDPIGRIGFLRWQLWRAARLVVDTGIHHLRWTRAQAVQSLSETTGDTPSVIETEVDRYIAAPGQACSYEIGRREMVRLREYARRALGPGFTLKGFHEQVLGAGEMPLSLLAGRVEAWVGASGTSASR